MADVIPELVRATALTYGDRLALHVDGSGRCTYRELDARAGAVAAGLRERGVGRGDLVGLLFATTAWFDYAPALLGVLKAGAAVVVLSAGATAEELRHIAGHCALRGVVTDRDRALPQIAEWSCALGELETGQPSDTAPVPVGADDLAMVLHTSGTTGRPKGVPLTHAHLAAPALGGLPKADPSVADRVLAPFPIASAAGQMVLAKELGCGNSLHLLPEFDADRFCDLVARHHVDRVNLVPAMGHWLARSGKHETTALDTVASVTFSSAPLPVAVLGEMRQLFPAARLENLYSATELAPGLVMTVVDPDRPASVGKPFEMFELLITDDSGAALPVGEQGEVRMRVPGIAGRGYLGDEQASTRTFDGDWVRTGDLGYLDEDGYLYLVDRRSDVLNPGGLKVAPSEVEAVLTEHPSVIECAVFGVEHPVLDQAVTAAVVTGADVSAVQLKQFARERLSDYKVPVAIHFVQSLPRNEIGKIQRAELARMAREQEFAREPVRPAGATERRLAELWRTVLGGDLALDGQSNFFAVGGHSLVVTQLVREITERFGVTPTMLGLFDHSTLAEQAAYLDTLATESTAKGQPRLRPLAAGEPAPQSYLQEYMWAAKAHCPNPGWNVFLTLRLEGRLDIEVLRETIAFLVRRHEVLRTRLGSDPAVQHVLPEVETDLAVIDLSEPADQQGELAEVCRARHRICLDLEHGPALLAALVRLAAEEHVLMLTMDHASCDGWSAGVLISEFAEVHDALAQGRPPELAPLPVRYRDIAAHQRRLAAAGAFDEHLGYWCRVLADLPAEPMLPRTTTAATGYRSGLRSLDVEPELARSVRLLASSRNDTVFMILLGTLMASIASVSRRSDVVVATLSAGRQHPEAGSVVGMFANPLLLRADVAPARTFHELFDAVRTATVGAYDHESVPFPVVAERVGQQSHRPEVWFNMAPPISLPSMKSLSLQRGDIPRNYSIEVPAEGWRGENLLVNGIDTGESMNLEFDYNTEQLDPAMIGRLCRTYRELLAAAVSDPSAEVPRGA